MADLGDALKSVLQVPGLQELLNNDITQQRQIAPVRSGVAQQAANMLPNSAFPGGRPNMAAIQPANFSTPAPSGGGNDLAKTLSLLGAGTGIGALLTKLLSGSNGNGASGDIGKLLSDLFKRNGMNYPIKPGDGFGGNHTTTYGDRDPFGSNLPSYQDPFGTLYGNGSIPTTGDFTPNDPSGGTGIGPGMQGYRNDPPPSTSGGGGGDNYGTDWWDE